MQPAADDVVPPWHVSVAVPDTVQAPAHVMLHVPAVQATSEPAPTVWVHDVPLHVTLQLGPQVPVHVAPARQLNLQPLVVALHVSKAQEPLGQSHAVPEQGGVPQAVMDPSAMTKRTRSVRMRDSGLTGRGQQCVRRTRYPRQTPGKPTSQVRRNVTESPSVTKLG